MKRCGLLGQPSSTDRVVLAQGKRGEQGNSVRNGKLT